MDDTSISQATGREGTCGASEEGGGGGGGGGGGRREEASAEGSYSGSWDLRGEDLSVGDVDVEAGVPGYSQGELRTDRKDMVVRRDTVVVRASDIRGPMRYVICYAIIFTFVLMIGGIVWLLMISPPFTIKPVPLPDRNADLTVPLTLTTALTTPATTSASQTDQP